MRKRGRGPRQAAHTRLPPACPPALRTRARASQTGACTHTHAATTPRRSLPAVAHLADKPAPVVARGLEQNVGGLQVACGHACDGRRAGRQCERSGARAGCWRASGRLRARGQRSARASANWGPAAVPGRPAGALLAAPAPARHERECTQCTHRARCRTCRGSPAPAGGRAVHVGVGAVGGRAEAASPPAQVRLPQACGPCLCQAAPPPPVQPTPAAAARLRNVQQAEQRPGLALLGVRRQAAAAHQVRQRPAVAVLEHLRWRRGWRVGGSSMAGASTVAERRASTGRA